MEELALEVPEVTEDLIPMLSHDLLGPIGNVIGFAELLERDLERDGSDPRNHLRRLMANAQHLQTVLEGTLASTWYPSRPPKREAVDLALLAQGSADRNALNAQNKEIAVTVAIDPGITPVTDRVRLGRILDNLVSNALKIAPRGTRVTIGAAREGARVRLWVTDQGPGLPGGAVSTRLLGLLPAARTRPDPGGHGLGLEIVRRLAHQLGGTAGVESRPGLGATFWVLLPM